MAQTSYISVYFSGRVQGVGFRFTTTNIASHFDVNGFVRNLRDGRVELYAEGESCELERFLESVIRIMRDNIEDTQASRGICEGRFHGFDIK